MGKVLVRLSTSAGGITAGAGSPGSEFWRLDQAVLGWVSGLRSCREQQSLNSGEDGASARLFEDVGQQDIH